MSYVKSIECKSYANGKGLYRVAIAGHHRIAPCSGTVRIEIFVYPPSETREVSRECCVYYARYSNFGRALSSNVYGERKQIADWFKANVSPAIDYINFYGVWHVQAL
jgi:nitric oxide synthase oxygenase domain/subunit